MVPIDKEEKKKFLMALEVMLEKLIGAKQRGSDTASAWEPLSLAWEIGLRRCNHKVPSVMVVEDDRFFRLLVQDALTGECLITSVESGRKALQAYPHVAPDAVFLDIHLPDMDGFEVLSKIREMDPEAYVVMFSGNSDQYNFVHAMRDGAQGFVCKPFTRQKLMDYIARSPHTLNEHFQRPA